MTGITYLRACPLCGANNADTIIDLDVGGFDQCNFSNHLQILACTECGMVYNEVPGGEEAIFRYYNEECLHAVNTEAGSGGMTSYDTARYAYTMDVLCPRILSKDAHIADVGCGQGGFLKFLAKQGYTHLTGVEAAPGCIPLLEDMGFSGKLGSLDSLPLGDHEVDVLTISHVLEHQYSLDRAMKEVRRVLCKGGLLYIEVPDATQYTKDVGTEIFWLGIKEHINHFSIEHLCCLLERYGFSVAATGTAQVAMPAIYVIAVCEDETDSASKLPGHKDKTKKAVLEYADIKNAQYSSFASEIKQMMAESRHIYAWGIGLHFLSLSKRISLDTYSKVTLVDRSLVVQQLTVFGNPVVSPEVLHDACDVDVVILAATAHEATMRKYLEEIGFSGKVITLF